MKLKLRVLYVCICCDSQVALNALHAVKTTSPLVQQCQKVLNDISARHTVGLYWVAGHARVHGNEMADRLAWSDSIQTFIGPELSLGGISVLRFTAGWITSILQCGMVLVVLRDGLKN